MRWRALTLRNRIAAFMLVTMVLLGAGIFLVGSERLRLLSDGYVHQLLEHQERHWGSTLNTLSLRLDDIADILIEDHAMQDAVSVRDATAVAAAVKGPLETLRHYVPVTMVEVIGSNGAVLYREGTRQSTPLVKGWPATNVLRFGVSTHGLHRFPDGEYGLLFMLPIPAQESELLTAPLWSTWLDQPDRSQRIIGAMVFGIPLAEAVRTLRFQMGRDVVITAPGSKKPLTDSLHPDLWPYLLEEIDTDVEGDRIVSYDDRSYEVTSFAIHHVDGRVGATLHSMRDITVFALRRNLMELATLTVSIIIASLMVWLLHGYLRRAFEPLDAAVTVLDRLARGDTSLGLTARHDDEVGRIAMAIEVFRERLLDLRRVDSTLRRQQRRQQAFIRRQMEALAATLESEARQVVLADLARIVEADHAKADTGDALAHELGLLAFAFRQMSERVRDQHVRLEHLVRELRDALEHKTRLIALEQELEIARNIQLSILPDGMAPVAGYDVAAHMVAAREVGGDFYDFFTIDEDRIGLVVADVSGKGVPAAFFMLIARTLMRATALFGMSPGSCLARVNDLLSGENEEMMFVTLFYGILDIPTGTLSYANAGHNPPLLRRRNGEVSEIPPTGGIAMAVLPGAAYAEARVQLAEGDYILMFSDGVTEAFAQDGTLFGQERLNAALPADGPASTVLATILRQVEAFVGGAEQSDDMTAMVLHRGAADTPSLSTGTGPAPDPAPALETGRSA